MTESQKLAMAAASAAAGASVDLLEHARQRLGPTDLQLTEVAETICDAAKLAIEARGIAEHEPELAQVHAALCKFLEDWA